MPTLTEIRIKSSDHQQSRRVYTIFGGGWEGESINIFFLLELKRETKNLLKHCFLINQTINIDFKKKS